MKKAKRYIFAFDADGEEVVWVQHADYTVKLMALSPHDLADTEVPVIDLRDPDFGTERPGGGAT
jgi:hypothetical protein